MIARPSDDGPAQSHNITSDLIVLLAVLLPHHLQLLDPKRAPFSFSWSSRSIPEEILLPLRFVQ
jgi:hypothetical protein